MLTLAVLHHWLKWGLPPQIVTTVPSGYLTSLWKMAQIEMIFDDYLLNINGKFPMPRSITRGYIGMPGKKLLK